MATIFYFLSKLVESGTMQMENAVSKTGEVYLVIPAKRSGFGKVQVKVQGSLRTLDAITDEEEDIPTGAVIVVKEITGSNALLVERSK